MSNQTIYVVTSGSYSDYGIRAIFSTKEKAEHYVSLSKETDPDEPHGIEEWTLDAMDNVIVSNVYSCYINLNTGDISRLVELSYKSLIQQGTKSDVLIGCNEINVTSYISKEHCEKIAIEARQKWLRKKKTNDV